MLLGTRADWREQMARSAAEVSGRSIRCRRCCPRAASRGATEPRLARCCLLTQIGVLPQIGVQGLRMHGVMDDDLSVAPAKGEFHFYSVSEWSLPGSTAHEPLWLTAD